MDDEYLERVMKRASDQKQAASKPEREASFHGIPIHTDASLPHGTIEFRDESGKLLGTIVDVGAAIGVQRS